MSCRKKRDLHTCVVKGRRAPGKSLGTWVIMLSLLPQECSTSSRPDPWPPVPSLPPNPKTPLLSAPTPSYSLFSVVISSSFTQLPKRSLQPGHPQPSGTPQALGTTQFLTQASSFPALSLGTQPSPGILSPLSHLRQPPLWAPEARAMSVTSVPSTLLEQMSCSIPT